MHHMKWALFGCALVGGLGCGAHELVVKASAAQVASMPARQSGLWEVTLRSEDLMLRRQGQVLPRSQTVRMCTTEQVEHIMLFAIVPGQENCRPLQVHRQALASGTRHTLQSECYVHENRVDSEMELHGDLQSEFRGSFAVRYEKTPIHNTGRMVFEGRRLGACHASQRPGDMVLPNGVTVNVVDDKRRVESAEKDHAGHGHPHSH